MDITTISILLKVIASAGGVFISVWIIKLLKEINSKQKEYIILIEKTFQEREKTRDQKIELLDTTHKKEIELIEREKQLFFKTIESEKKNLELQLSNTPKSENSLINNLITDLKSDLSLVVSKLSRINILSEDLTQMKEIVGIAGDINRKANFIASEESNSFSNKDSGFRKKEIINLKEFILKIFNNIYSSSLQLVFEPSITNLRPIVFNKRVLYLIMTEIFSNARHHSTSEYLRIYGSETPSNTKIVFENASQLRAINATDTESSNIKNKFDLRPNGLYVIKDIMKRYNNEVYISRKDEKFEVELNFNRNDRV